MKYLRLLNVIIFTSIVTLKISIKEIDTSLYFFILFLLSSVVFTAHDLYEVENESR